MFKEFYRHRLNGTDTALLVAQDEVRRRLKWVVISIMVMLILGSVNVPVGYEWFKFGLNVCASFIAFNIIIALKRSVSSYISTSNAAVEYYKQITEDALNANQGDK